MPAATLQQPTLESLTSLLTLTYPTPTPTTHADLVTTNDLHREEDLLRNTFSFRHWWTAIQNAKETSAVLQKSEGPLDLEPEVAALLGPLSSPAARQSLQRQTYLYEAALAHFPGSFKLWKSYLHTRMSFVLGKLIHRKKAGGRKKFPDMREALDDGKEDLEQWDGGLDGVVGWEEWRLLVALFERCLMWLPRVSLLDMYILLVSHISVDATNLATLSVNIQPSILSSSNIPYSRSSNLRPCIAHPAAIPSFPNMDPLFAMGRVERRRDYCRCVPTVSFCRPECH